MAESERGIDPKREKKFEKPNVVFEWVAPAHVHIDREHNFFVVLFVFAVVFSFILVLFHQYTFTMVVLAAAFAIYATNKHRPVDVHYQVLTDSIKIDDSQYYYDDLVSFWFEDIHDQTVLKVLTLLNHPHRLDLVIDKSHQEEVEALLLDYIPYQKVKENRVIQWIEQLIFPHSPKRVSET